MSFEKDNNFNRPPSRPLLQQSGPIAPQPIIQNIKIDKSTNNVYNFYNYSNSDQVSQPDWASSHKHSNVQSPKPNGKQKTNQR